MADISIVHGPSLIVGQPCSPMARRAKGDVNLLANAQALESRGTSGVIFQTYFALAVLGLMTAALNFTTINLSIFYLLNQDLWLLSCGILLLIFCHWRVQRQAAAFYGTWRLALVAAMAMAIAAFAGHYLILSGYDLTRDEQMANFDALIFANGQLVASLPLEWREHADALNTNFMHDAAFRTSWVSGYFPSNAALRALLGLIVTPTLAGPLMTVAGALALWGCARRIWPENREAPVVALVLYLGSSQILFNGMTSYAMPAHLALNLCWLWFFLRRRWWADAAALSIGFVAVGLHQIHYHPMFAAPLLCLLLIDRNWWRAAFFLLGYSAVCLFWLEWPSWSGALLVTGDAHHGGFLTRAITNLRELNFVEMRFPNMAANLLRFAAWQHLLLIPLAVLGIKAVQRNRLAAALATGIAITLLFRLALLPYQGHGFGYRSLHGFIGSGILLATYGWVALGDDVARWRAVMIRTTLAGWLILLPIQGWMAHHAYGVAAEVSESIDASGADFAIVGGTDAPYSADLVINRPYLDNQPVRLLRSEVTPSLQRIICQDRSSIYLVGPDALLPVSNYFNVDPAIIGREENRALAQAMRKLGCRTTIAPLSSG